MKLQQLKYLLAIVDNGLNITAAAESLYTSQPGVSKQLKLLEEELGLQLFIRKGKSLDSITPGGKKVIERARIIMREAENIHAIAADYYRDEEGTLSIATTHTQARYVLPDTIAEFRRQYPNVRVDLHQGTSEQIAHMVDAGNIDFAIATGSRELFTDLLLIPSYRWDRSIVVTQDHPLTRIERALTIADLAEYPLVTYVFSFGSQSSLTQAFKEQGLDPDVVFTARDADVIKTYARMGLGVGIIAGMAADHTDEGLAVIDASGLFPRSTTWIGYRKNTILRRYMTDFLLRFAPHITSQQLKDIQRAGSQAELDKLFAGAELPVRGRRRDDVTAAA